MRLLDEKAPPCRPPLHLPGRQGYTLFKLPPQTKDAERYEGCGAIRRMRGCAANDFPQKSSLELQRRKIRIPRPKTTIRMSTTQQVALRHDVTGDVLFRPFVPADIEGTKLGEEHQF